MEDYQVEHGQGSLVDYSSMPSMPLMLSQLGITSPGHVARNYPYTGAIPYYSDSETQNPAETQMPPSGESQMTPPDESQMSPSDESQMPPPEEGHDDARADDFATQPMRRDQLRLMGKYIFLRKKKSIICFVQLT